MSSEHREQMLHAVENPNGFESLKQAVQGFLDNGVPSDTLLEDLGQIRGLVSTDDEDKVLDVMDLVVGWCAPQFRLTPSKPGE